MRTLLAALRWTFLLGAVLFVAGVPPFATSDATGLQTLSGPLVVTVSPVVNLADGQTVNIHAEAATGTVIYSITAHTCVPGKVNGDHSFGFTGQYCPNVPIGSGQIEKLATFPGATSADMPYTVGTGAVSWYNEMGFQYALTCDDAHPCDMVLKIEITNGTQYVRIPLCYGTQCPPDSPPGGGGPPATGSAGASPSAGSTQTPAAAGATGSAAGSGSSTADASSKHPPGASQAVSDAAPSHARAQGGGTSHSSAPAADESLSAAQAASITSPVGDSSRGLRVFVAALAGALCTARVISVISRTRRRAGMGTA
jgi:hypothetical protein